MLISDSLAINWNEVLAAVESEQGQKFTLCMVVSPNGDLIASYSSDPNSTLVKNTCALGAADYQLVQLLTHTVAIGDAQTIQIDGSTQSFIILSLDVNHSIIILAKGMKDPRDLEKSILKQIISKLMQNETKETFALIQQDGLPVWGLGLVDEFTFSLALSSILSLTERMQLELKLGSTSECEIIGENMAIRAFFIESQDLMLSMSYPTQAYKKERIQMFSKLYSKIVSSTNIPFKLPEWSQNQDERENVLTQLRDTKYEADEKSETEAMEGFSEEVINFLEKEILELQRRYRAREVSIAYLCHRTKLPPAVVSMTLDFLISSARLGNTKIGISSGLINAEVLILEDIADQNKQSTKTPMITLKDALLDAVQPYFSQIVADEEKEHRETQETQLLQSFGKTLGEYQVLRTLADVNQVIILADQIQVLIKDLKKYSDSITTFESKIAITTDTKVQEDIKMRLISARESHVNIKRELSPKLTDFQNELLKSYELLSFMFPLPYDIRIKNKSQATLKFRCFAVIEPCDVAVEFVDDVSSWVKMIFFFSYIKNQPPSFLRDYPKEVREQYAQIKEFWNTIAEKNYDKLKELTDLSQIFLSDLEKDHLIAIMNMETVNFYAKFRHCQKCGKWMCMKHSSDDNFCKMCRD